jgi:hypothetical protein
MDKGTDKGPKYRNQPSPQPDRFAPRRGKGKGAPGGEGKGGKEESRAKSNE